ncbi:MAG: nitroreductase family protein [Bacteroidetes bacterium]|nr:nitroreductase family protein [Bacteroidota bacterium]
MQAINELIKNRKSSRIPFDINRKVSPENIKQILEAGSWAPTAHNMQNFEILLIDDLAKIEEVRSISLPPSQTFIQENYLQLSFSEEDLRRKRTGVLATMFPKSWLTPTLIPENRQKEEAEQLTENHHQLLPCPLLMIVLYNPSRRAPGSEGDFLGIISIGCVLENMWLMATSLGISMHVISALGNQIAENKIKEMFAIPAYFKIAIAFRLGYPAGPISDTLRVRRDLHDFTHHNNFKGNYFD